MGEKKTFEDVAKELEKKYDEVVELSKELDDLKEQKVRDKLYLLRNRRNAKILLNGHIWNAALTARTTYKRELRRVSDILND